MRLESRGLIMMQALKILNEDVPYYVAPFVKTQLTKAIKECYEQDQDRVYLITGREGLGKSRLAMQLAYFCDRSFCLDDIVFNAETFKKRVRTVSKHKAIVFDECFRGLSSKGALSQENKQLVRLLMECRQRNLFIFLVLPSFFLLEKYAALFRSTALFNVLKCKPDPKQRYYKVYNYSQKRMLYIKGKPTMSYNYPFVRFNYRFFKGVPPTINIEEYTAKKYKAFKEPEQELERLSKKDNVMKNMLGLLKTEFKIPATKMAKLLRERGCNVSDRSLNRWTKDGIEKSTFAT